MAAISQFLSHLSTMTMVFFTLLLVELVIMVRSISRTLFPSAAGRPITAARFLELVEEKNPTCRYRVGSTARKVEAVECAVCLSKLEEGEEVRKLMRCDHVFHKDCLDRWLQQDCATCPLCRSTVLAEEIVEEFRRRQDGGEAYDGSDEEVIFMLSALHGSNSHMLL